MTSDVFDVRLTRAAEKDIAELRPWQARVVQALLGLEREPYKGHTLQGSLKPARSIEFSLPGSGAHRAVYVVLEDARVCLVFLVGPHENVYDKAERRLAALRAQEEI